jgi:hypothetical protein
LLLERGDTGSQWSETRPIWKATWLHNEEALGEEKRGNQNNRDIPDAISS